MRTLVYLYRAFLPGVCALVVASVSSEAATFTVTSTADPGNGVCTVATTGHGCTLREAIPAANGNTGDDTITFASGVSGIIQLTAQLPDLSTNIALEDTPARTLRRCWQVRAQTEHAVQGRRWVDGRMREGSARAKGIRPPRAFGLIVAGSVSGEQVITTEPDRVGFLEGQAYPHEHSRTIPTACETLSGHLRSLRFLWCLRSTLHQADDTLLFWRERIATLAKGLFGYMG